MRTCQSWWLTIDECFYGCRSEISWQYYNPNKPDRYGLDVKYFNEVKFPFTYICEVFAWKPQNIEHAEYYVSTNHDVTMSSWNDSVWEIRDATLQMTIYIYQYS